MESNEPSLPMLPEPNSPNIPTRGAAATDRSRPPVNTRAVMNASFPAGHDGFNRDGPRSTGNRRLGSPGSPGGSSDAEVPARLPRALRVNPGRPGPLASPDGLAVRSPPPGKRPADRLLHGPGLCRGRRQHGTHIEQSVARGWSPTEEGTDLAGYESRPWDGAELGRRDLKGGGFIVGEFDFCTGNVAFK